MQHRLIGAAAMAACECCLPAVVTFTQGSRHPHDSTNPSHSFYYILTMAGPCITCLLSS
jgi:hypothetical protein